MRNTYFGIFRNQNTGTRWYNLQTSEPTARVLVGTPMGATMEEAKNHLREINVRRIKSGLPQLIT